MLDWRTHSPSELYADIPGRSYRLLRMGSFWYASRRIVGLDNNWVIIKQRLYLADIKSACEIDAKI